MTARRPAALVAVVLCLLLAACGATGDGTDGDTGDATTPSPTPTTLSTATAEPEPEVPDLGAPVEPGGSGTHTVHGRRVEIAVPAEYDDATPAPLIMVLHGFGSRGAEVDAFLGLRTPADERGALYVVPEGTTDSGKRKFWNATEACCDFSRSQIDDSGYLASVLRAVAATYSVDASRVVVVGHSNGGFMAYRMACDHADLVTHALSLAGAMPVDQADCAPTDPVSVLQVHGTADPLIKYDGGNNGPFPYPSARVSVEAWALLNGCSVQPDEAPEALDLDPARPGSETSVTAFSGCDDGTRVELWSIDGAGHGPALSDDFPDALLDYALGRS